jgi:hypothetical protein
MRESFLIYKEFYPAIESLSNDQLGKLFRALFMLQREGIECNEPDIKMAFEFFKNQFRLDDIKYLKTVERNQLNGKKGGRPSITQDNPKNPVGLKKPKKPDKDKDNDKDKDIKEVNLSPAFLRFLEIGKTDFPNVLKMKEPITELQLAKLIQDHGKDKVVETLKDMHNWKPLLTKNTSANRTCEKWIKKDKSGNTTNQVKPKDHGLTKEQLIELFHGK